MSDVRIYLAQVASRQATSKPPNSTERRTQPAGFCYTAGNRWVVRVTVGVNP